VNAYLAGCLKMNTRIYIADGYGIEKQWSIGIGKSQVFLEKLWNSKRLGERISILPGKY